MPSNSRDSEAIAQQYIGTVQSLTRLGWGISGVVYLSPDLQTAVKVHHYKESYSTEVRAYKRLKRLRLKNILGLTIPTLRDSRDDLSLIRIDFVSPPYLLEWIFVRATSTSRACRDWLHHRIDGFFVYPRPQTW